VPDVRRSTFALVMASLGQARRTILCGIAPTHIVSNLSQPERLSSVTVEQRSPRRMPTSPPLDERSESNRPSTGSG
jgi:hypothetical protein